MIIGIAIAILVSWPLGVLIILIGLVLLLLPQFRGSTRRV
jgi:hypothetical protein